ncbi:MAG: ATP-grasp domain-containing protein [Anaerolineae bacterium]
MKIAVLANFKQNAPTWEGMPPDQWDDLDSPKTVDHIIKALESGGHEARFFEASIRPPHNLIERLQEYQPDLCFNIAEGHFGDGREAQIPAVLEMLGIPYTGSKVLTLALTLDKPMTKRILAYHGLPTPEFQVFESADEPIDDSLLDARGDLRFPMFVKPSREGTGMGVSAESIVRSVAELRAQVARQIERYSQPILVERYIKGREITVGVVGNLGSTAARRLTEQTAPAVLPEELTFFPPLEVDLAAYDPSEAGLYTNRIKVEMAEDFRYLCPAPLDDDLRDLLFRLTAAVFRVTGSCDAARVDFRLDEEDGNRPYILEINPLPGLNPLYSDLCVEAYAYGWTYEQLINTIVQLAVERQAARGVSIAARVRPW